jgi:hypothetical protein
MAVNSNTTLMVMGTRKVGLSDNFDSNKEYKIGFLFLGTETYESWGKKV